MNTICVMIWFKLSEVLFFIFIICLSMCFRDIFKDAFVEAFEKRIKEDKERKQLNAKNSKTDDY